MAQSPPSPLPIASERVPVAGSLEALSKRRKIDCTSLAEYLDVQQAKDRLRDRRETVLDQRHYRWVDLNENNVDVCLPRTGALLEIEFGRRVQPIDIFLRLYSPELILKQANSYGVAYQATSGR